MKNIIINVDDLGFSHAVNQAVIDLAEKERIQATSFMSLGEVHKDEVKALQSHHIDIGLHFDLTGLAGVGNLKNVLLKAYLGKFQSNELQSIIQQQLDCFEQKIGKQPDFIDGHQHVHQFPQVREALLACVEQRYKQKIPIRNTKTYQTDLKAKIIYFLGGYALKRSLVQQQWPHNPAFSGIYGFNTDLSGLITLWDSWLENAPNDSVIMCHPAQKDPNWTDEIYAARCVEYEWLMSDEFLALWNKYQCQAQSWKSFSK